MTPQRAAVESVSSISINPPLLSPSAATGDGFVDKLGCPAEAVVASSQRQKLFASFRRVGVDLGQRFAVGLLKSEHRDRSESNRAAIPVRWRRSFLFDLADDGSKDADAALALFDKAA